MILVKTFTKNSLSRLSKLFKQSIPGLNELGVLTSILFLEFFMLRVFEFFYLKYHYGFEFSNALYELKGIYYDFVFASILALISFIPFLLLYSFLKKIIRPLFLIINTILIITYLILIDYLRFTFTPLDHALFAYPLNELVYIAKTSVNFGFLQILKYLTAIVISGFTTYLLFKNATRFKFYLAGIFFLAGGIFLSKNINPSRRNYPNELSFNLTINKLSYLSKSSANFFLGRSDINQMEFRNVVKKYHQIHSDFNFVNPNYPLERKPDTTDKLGAFFNLYDEPPNLVFVIMESLSSAFCGSNAYMGNFTPFLDSLINQSLYWENFLSTSERTFNTIPSIFGSLPYGEKGFMELVKPDFSINHTTLIQWLNKQGYFSSFYYGGWTGFDNMENFFNYQDIDYILKHFGENYTPIEKDKNGFSWGYPDQSLFTRSLEIIDSLNQYPRLDIYLTISLHHPFNPPNKAFYLQKFESQLKKLNLDKNKTNEIRNQADIFATVLYTDDAIRHFINQYKTREDFENTIFIITGDHRLGTQNTRNALDKYHVPFIIYSPMLKKAEKFASVSSHLNVAPTLYSFMAKNFGFKMPSKVHWVGTQIDTAKNFRNKHIIPLMRTSRDISDFLSHKYFISKKEIYKLSDSLKLMPVNNKTLKDSIIHDLNSFKIINQYITQHNLVLTGDNLK